MLIITNQSKVGHIINREVASLCSDKTMSVLGKTKKNDLLSFKWEKIIQEAETVAPCLLHVLKISLQTKKPLLLSLALLYLSCATLEEDR